MKTTLFDFHLPDSHIATQPANPRDSARMLVVPREGDFAHQTIQDFPDFLRAGDVLVLNESRVIPARLFGTRGAAKVEVLLHKKTTPLSSSSSSGLTRGSHAVLAEEAKAAEEEGGPRVKPEDDGVCWAAFAKPAKRLRVGDSISFAENFSATVTGKLETGEVILHFAMPEAAFYQALNAHGQMPLPPYIQSKRAADAGDCAHYQTVYAKTEGSVAAPTAGLHFTPELLARIEAKGVRIARVVLHVGAGTFQPVKVEDTDAHVMHTEWAEVSAETAEIINAAKRVVAVGTTSLRTLESACDEAGRVHAFAGETGIFITPGYRFKCVKLLLTNFHLPKSTLFMLVSAFSGLERIKAAYALAIKENYRFYSYGDACLLEC